MSGLFGKNRVKDIDYVGNGRIGERATYSLLKWIFPDYAVLDMTSNPDYFSKDIDFVVVGDHWQKYIDAKYDQYMNRASPNFVFEFMRVYHNQPPENALYRGWSDRSEAHGFCIWCPGNRNIYYVTHNALVEGLQRYIAKVEKPYLGAVPTDENVTTFNVYIPSEYVLHTVYHHDEHSGWNIVSET